MPEDSTTETYAALRLEVDNWRWAGVPIYLRTGKRLARKVTEIAVTLKPVPHLAFEQAGSVGVQPNQIVMTMQPNEGVSLSLGREDPRHPDADPPGEHGVPLRHGVHVAVARGLRAAASSTPCAATPRSSPATTRSRRSGGSSTRSSRPGAQTPGPLPQYPAGSQRPGRGRRAARPRPPAGGRSDARCPTSGVWSAQDTTPAAIEEALRELLKEQHAKRRPSCPRGCSTWSRSSTASGAARSTTGSTASAATTPRARSSARSSRARHDRRLGHGVGGPGSAPRRDLALTHERVILDVGPRAPARARHDRRPARGHRPGHRRAGRRTATPRPSTRCCSSRRSS